MIWIAVLGATFWLSYTFFSRRRRQRERELERERMLEGPSPQSELGQRARRIAEEQDAKLASPPLIHGSARWADAADARELVDPTHLLRIPEGTAGLRLGMLGDGSHLVAKFPGHILTVAGTGQGKSATQIVEALLTYRGSTLVFDPKGELYAATADRRRQFGKVYRLAPFDWGNSNRYNPMLELEHGGHARRLAEMIVVRAGDKGASNASYFENEAVNLLTAVIQFVVERAREENRPHLATLAKVREICSLPMLGAERAEGVDYLDDWLLDMMQNAKSAGVRQAGSTFFGYDAEKRTHFISELNANMSFWHDQPGLAHVTGASDFRLADLEREPTTLFIEVPLKWMYDYFRFVRIMVGMAIMHLEEKRNPKEASVLFLLDEFAALKEMSFMKNAVAELRSAGAWFWFFVQDLSQLKDTYHRNGANLFLSQTDHQVFFGGVLDGETRQYVSNALGQATVAYRDPEVSWSHQVNVNEGVSEPIFQAPTASRGSGASQTYNFSESVKLVARPLLTPDEVGAFLGQNRSNTIILSKHAGGRPIRALRQHWESVDVLREAQAAGRPSQNPIRAFGGRGLA